MCTVVQPTIQNNTVIGHNDLGRESLAISWFHSILILGRSVWFKAILDLMNRKLRYTVPNHSQLSLIRWNTIWFFFSTFINQVWIVQSSKFLWESTTRNNGDHFKLSRNHGVKTVNDEFLRLFYIRKITEIGQFIQPGTDWQSHIKMCVQRCSRGGFSLKWLATVMPRENTKLNYETLS